MGLPWEDYTVRLRTVVSIIGVVVTAVGLYYGISQRIKDVETQAAHAVALAEAHERALVELVATLRAKEVIK